MTLTITLELTPEQEANLRKHAAQAGTDVAGYVIRLADRPVRSRRKQGRKPQTGAELAEAIMKDPDIAGYGDSNIDSPALARQLRRSASTRDWSQ